jgi:fatty-acyl-CoA synthase
VLFDFPFRTLSDVKRFESEKTFEARCPWRSVYDVFSYCAERFSDDPALTVILTGEEDETPKNVSYRELLEGITRAANFFHDIAGPGAGVGIMLPHLPETQFALWGAETVGYALPINFLLQTAHIAHLLRSAEVKVLLALGPSPQSDIWEKAVAISELLPELKLVQVSPPGISALRGALHFSESLARYSGSKLSFGEPRAGDAVAAYFHTGGTTGAPKLAAHTHRNQIVASFGGAAMLQYSKTDVLTHGLPLFHVAGTIACGLAFFMAGGRILLLSPAGFRNPRMIQNMWRISRRYGATILGGVPTVLAALVDVPLGGVDVSGARLAITGGSSSPNSMVERFERKTGLKVHEIFGMTECGGLAAIAPAAAEPVTGSVGLRLPYTSISARKLQPDGSLGEECAVHEVGVLTIAGPTVSPGYKGIRDDDTIRNGVVNSGDLAYSDEEGRIYIAGRAKDLIIRSGHNIDPQTIEEAVSRHPAVSLAAAVGQPDRYAGELPVCYVTLKPGMKATVEELRAFAEPLIPERPAWPKRYHVVDAIPVTGVGKIFKPELRVDSVRRFVMDAIEGAIGREVSVAVSAGGKRGMAVSVVVPALDDALRERLRDVLEGYNFDYTISASDDAERRNPG